MVFRPIDAQAVPGPQLDLEESRRSATSESSTLAGSGRLTSTREPKSLAFWLKARPEDRRVHGVCKAVAHVSGTLIFDVQVELTDV